MDNIQDQIRDLQASVRRQRFAIVALGTILVGTALIGAVRPAGDATFDTITCKAWKVVDKDGKWRISAAAYGNGLAAVAWYDKDEKTRIEAGTNAKGSASVKWYDENHVTRMAAETVRNSALVQLSDDKGRMRIAAHVSENGASVSLFDKDERAPINAATLGSDLVIYPTKDGK